MTLGSDDCLGPGDVVDVSDAETHQVMDRPGTDQGMASATETRGDSDSGGGGGGDGRGDGRGGCAG